MSIIKEKCPRCGTKHLEHDIRCSECGLVFERLKDATNSAAKEKIKAGEGKDVVYIRKTPSDIKRYKLILLAIFTGFFGGHCFYVGRYKRAFTMLILGIFAFIAFYFNITNTTPVQIKTLLTIITAVVTFMWLFDVFDVCVHRFKIPVYIKK